MRYTYLLINIFTILIPLLRSAEKRLRFYTKWRWWVPAILITGIFFIVWDYFKTKYGVWGFNDKYIIGVKFFGLPLEELLFFITVPYACIFIYEALSTFIINRVSEFNTHYFTWAYGALSFAASFLAIHRAYTFTVLFLGGLILPAASFILNGKKLTLFYITYLIALLPMLVVNGLLTALPVVIYNNHENLNHRIGTIPVEDFIYAAILLMMNIAIYQWGKDGYANLLKRPAIN